MPGKRRLISNFSRSYFLLVNTIRLVLDIFFTDIFFHPCQEQILFHWWNIRGFRAAPGCEQRSRNVAGHMDDGESRPSWLWIHFGRNGTSCSNNLPSPTIDRSGLIHPDNDNSGHIHMTPATSVQLQIKQSTGSPSRQCRMETIFTTMFCHIYLDRDCRDVLVTERTIPGQNMQTELMSGDLHRRLTCSRLRWVGSH